MPVSGRHNARLVASAVVTLLVAPWAAAGDQRQVQGPERTASPAADGATPRGPRRHLRPATNAVRAWQNLHVDPLGRVVDVLFDGPLQLTCPWDRFRFDIDVVQPLSREGSAFVADLDGDGVRDLLLGSWNGDLAWYPGQGGSPTRFGAGTLLRRLPSTGVTGPEAEWNSDSYAISWSGDFTGGDVGDLDGDGVKEIVVYGRVFRNVGTATRPLLHKELELLPDIDGLDRGASLGDLDGDGDLDVLFTASYAPASYILSNGSTPGHIAFSTETLPHLPGTRGTLGDLNGDGLLDVATAYGVFFNRGTRLHPDFDFSSPTPWRFAAASLFWVPTGDLGTNIDLVDATGDGLLDAYVSGVDGTPWQVLFYQNVGTAQTPVFRYVGPVVVARTPANLFNRTTYRSGLPGGGAAYAQAADLDGDGRSDVVVSTDVRELRVDPAQDMNGAVLWNRGTATDSSGNTVPELVYPDLYSFPFLEHLERCDGRDALCRPPQMSAAWLGVSGQGFADLLRVDYRSTFEYALYLMRRSGGFPFVLGPNEVVASFPSGAQITGFGVAVTDLDRDGRADLVAGGEQPTLRWLRNASTPGAVSFVDPVTLADATGAPLVIDPAASPQVWPTAIDLDGDGKVDLLVADSAGMIHTVYATMPASAQGFQQGALLSAPEATPVDVTHAGGGGIVAPSLATADLDGDGRADVIMGDASSRLWLLHNRTTGTAASFHLEPLPVSRTGAAFLEALDGSHARLHFGIPVEPAVTRLSYRQLPTDGAPTSGSIVIGADDAVGGWPTVPAGCSLHVPTDLPGVIRAESGSVLESTIVVADSGALTDVNVVRLAARSEKLLDLRVALASPSGTRVTLADFFAVSGCFDETRLDISLGDGAPAALHCPAADGSWQRPAQPFAAFSQQESKGAWTLTVTNCCQISTAPGVLERWGLVICR
jgi:hypothetical protein